MAALVAAAALAFSGCGSDDAAGGDDPSGAETSSGSTTEEPTETPSETATETPTETPSVTPSEPAVEPASGPELEVSGFRVSAPKGWQQTFSSVFVDTALGRVDHQSGGLVLSVASLSGDVLTPQEAERYFWTPGEKPPNYERQDPVVIGADVRAGYYTSRDKYDDLHSVTLQDGNHVVKVEVSFGQKVTEDRQQELLQSVLASYSAPQD